MLAEHAVHAAPSRYAPELHAVHTDELVHVVQSGMALAHVVHDRPARYAALVQLVHVVLLAHVTQLGMYAEHAKQLPDERK